MSNAYPLNDGELGAQDLNPPTALALPHASEHKPSRKLLG